jgi:hypothetical protein
VGQVAGLQCGLNPLADDGGPSGGGIGNDRLNQPATNSAVHQLGRQIFDRSLAILVGQVADVGDDGNHLLQTIGDRWD